MNRRAILATLVSLLTGSAFAWDFDYGYRDVFSARTNKYVVAQHGIQTYQTTNFSYYTPVYWGVGSITYTFRFRGSISNAYLKANIGAAWPADSDDSIFYSMAGLMASKDGQSWVRLLHLTPAGTNFQIVTYDQNLPESLLGSDEIYVSVFLLSFAGLSGFSISEEGSSEDVFQFKASLVPEPRSNQRVATLEILNPGSTWWGDLYTDGLHFQGVGRTIDYSTNWPYNGTHIGSPMPGASVRALGGRPFDLISIDLAEYSYLFAEPTDVLIYGYRSDDTVVRQTFRLDGVINGTGPLRDFQTFYFSNDFKHLKTVYFGGGFTFDNLRFRKR